MSEETKNDSITITLEQLAKMLFITDSRVHTKVDENSDNTIQLPDGRFSMKLGMAAYIRAWEKAEPKLRAEAFYRAEDMVRQLGCCKFINGK